MISRCKKHHRDYNTLIGCLECSENAQKAFDLFDIHNAPEEYEWQKEVLKEIDNQEWIGGLSECPHIKTVYDAGVGYTRCHGCGALKISSEDQREIQEALDRR